MVQCVFTARLLQIYTTDLSGARIRVDTLHTGDWRHQRRRLIQTWALLEPRPMQRVSMRLYTNICLRGCTSGRTDARNGRIRVHWLCVLSVEPLLYGTTSILAAGVQWTRWHGTQAAQCVERHLSSRDGQCKSEPPRFEAIVCVLSPLLSALYPNFYDIDSRSDTGSRSIRCALRHPMPSIM